MIKRIEIENYKSVRKLEFNLGRFNILIGENGCGKSNVLEAIAMAGAASAHKLDNEYFSNRGIRVAAPTFMRSAFENADEKNIVIKVVNDLSNQFKYNLYYDENVTPQKWVDANNENTNELMKAYASIMKEDKTATLSDLKKVLEERFQSGEEVNVVVESQPKSIRLKFLSNEIPELSSFVIYSLEESKLRMFDNSNSLYPFGRNGEGLFAYLKELAQDEKKQEIIAEIKENLDVLDWYDDMEIPKNQLSQDYSIRIKDRYIDESLNYFDQRSTNEGFLNLLFYLTLFISKDTPSFFAIDNIESSFNPKMCRKVVGLLAELAVKHGKQVIATTHNPAVLDGLDLSNDEMLFVVRRDLDGHTKLSPIKYNCETKVPLSEAWMKGYIGGLPNNF